MIVSFNSKNFAEYYRGFIEVYGNLVVKKMERAGLLLRGIKIFFAMLQLGESS